MTEWVELNLHQFCIKLEHSSAETIQMIQKVFGDDAMSAVQIKVWQKCLKNGQESIGCDPHSGRPVTSRTPENVECVWAAINKDQWLTVWELDTDWGIPKTTVSEILMQIFGMKHVAKFVPWLLLPKQKEHHVAVANDTGWTLWSPNIPILKEPEVSLSYVVFLVSCTFFNKCLYFTFCMAGYFMDRPHISQIYLVFTHSS